MSDNSKLILDILKKSTAYLEKNLLPSPRLEAELLISHALGCKRLDLYLRFDQPLSEDELETIRAMLKRRANHEPIQYIIGKTDFYNCTFLTDERALIPRMDTEILVEETINVAKKFNLPKILDIGTGSGCIAISLAKNIKTKLVAAVDYSADAISLAKENALLNGVENSIIFALSDVMTNFRVKEKFEIVVSNPPYIAMEEMGGIEREVKDFEPLNALTDNSDGLSFYRRLAYLAKEIIVAGGYLLVECGYLQGEQISDIFAQQGLKDIEIIRDLSGNQRVVKAKVANCI